MKEYMLSVFAVSVLVGTLSFISYKFSEGARKFAFAILVLYVTASPIADMAGNFDISEIFDSQDSLAPEVDDGYSEIAENAFRDGVRAAVCDEFSLDGESVRVLISNFDFSQMRAERIKIILSGRAALADYKGIERYVNELDLGECDVEIEIG